MEKALTAVEQKWNVVSVVKGGSLKFHFIDFDKYFAPIENAPSVVWNENETVGVINGGKNIFKGIIRGMGISPITYLFNNISELDFIALDEWIYTIKGVN